MFNIKKNWPLVGLALCALGASVVAINSEFAAVGQAPAKVVAVQPDSEESSAAEVLRRTAAIKQPTGQRSANHSRPVPSIASPQR